MNWQRVTPLRVQVQKLDRLYYAFAEHRPEDIFRSRDVWGAVGQVLVRYRDIIAVHGLGAVSWFREDGSEVLCLPLPATDCQTERFRRELRPGHRKAA